MIDKITPTFFCNSIVTENLEGGFFRHGFNTTIENYYL